MAVMGDSERIAVWAELMSDLSDSRETVPVVKADLRAAVDALDLFLSDNAAAINAAIPQPARGALTTAQKARLLTYVIRRRYITGA